MGLSKAMEKIKKKIRQNYIKCSQKQKNYWYMFRSSLLFERSYENKLTKGLGILKGEVLYFNKKSNVKNKFNVDGTKYF